LLFCFMVWGFNSYTSRSELVFHPFEPIFVVALCKLPIRNEFRCVGTFFLLFFKSTQVVGIKSSSLRSLRLITQLSRDCCSPLGKKEGEVFDQEIEFQFE
jgi:hypothetical protein